jgi:beta-barrel assembly-enhancing protease
MKKAVLTIAVLLGAGPAFAQFGQLGEIQRRAGQAKKIADLNISEQEEHDLGERVSGAVRSEFGVLQDKELTKYVTLIGNLMAKASTRPDLKWEFIVLDTDGVNAFAAPGGLVHITKGALGLMRNEAELAGVLGHEIAHITKKHSIDSLRTSNATKLVTEEAGSRTSYFYTMLADAVYDNIVEKGFDRGQENQSDEEGARLANKVGYNPVGLTSFLQKLIDRNKDRKAAKPNGLFSTHPDTKDRIDRVTKQIKKENLNATAMGETRYAANVKIEAKPVNAVALSTTSAKGVAGAESASKPADPPKEEKKEEKKKGGGMFGGLASGLSTGKQKESTQASASAGGRAVDPTRPDRFSAGGGNPNKIAIAVTLAELDTFKKGIA